MHLKAKIEDMGDIKRNMMTHHIKIEVSEVLQKTHWNKYVECQGDYLRRKLLFHYYISFDTFENTSTF